MGSAYSPHETISLKLKDNQHKIDACTLYVHGQTKLARQYHPEYIQSLEKRSEHKTDFIFGILIFVIVTLCIVYYIIPKVGTSQLAVLTLFLGIFSTFFAIEYATRRIRSVRLTCFLESKEIPRLKREIDTQKSGIETLLMQRKKQKTTESKNRRRRQSDEENHDSNHREHEEWRRQQKKHLEEERRRREQQEESQYRSSNEETMERFKHPQGKMTSKDALRILQLPPDSVLKDLQKAYRESIAQYHPDHVAHLAPEFKWLAEKRSKLINQAYEYLQDLFNK